MWPATDVGGDEVLFALWVGLNWLGRMASGWHAASSSF